MFQVQVCFRLKIRDNKREIMVGAYFTLYLYALQVSMGDLDLKRYGYTSMFFHHLY